MATDPGPDMRCSLEYVSKRRDIETALDLLNRFKSRKISFSESPTSERYFVDNELMRLRYRGERLSRREQGSHLPREARRESPL